MAITTRKTKTNKNKQSTKQRVQTKENSRPKSGIKSMKMTIGKLREYFQELGKQLKIIPSDNSPVTQ